MEQAVVGVDGCPGGWVAARVGPGPLTPASVRWSFWPVAATAEMLTGPGSVAIDMPIGLPDRGPRACDLAAREALGPRRHSVFLVPSRAVLDSPDHAAACARARLRGEAAPSVQLWGLVPRIRLLDEVLAGTDGRAGPVVECHPELAFRTLTGRVLAAKRTAAGVGQRMAALGATGPVLAGAPAQARIDDALDALVCAWTAERWTSGSATVVGDGARDARGLPMRIVS